MIESKKTYGTVLIKAHKILDVLSQSTEPLTLNQIATQSELTISTTSKILDTLQTIEYVHRNELDKRFSIGIKLMQFANTSFMQFDIVRESYPILKKLHDKFGETVHLGMLRNDSEVIYINKFASNIQNNKMHSQIGASRDLFCSAMGKAILSTFDSQRFNRYLDSIKLTPYTTHTITDKAQLISEIVLCRSNGYGIDNREIENETFCIGASLQSEKHPENIYAFSVSIPYYRLTEDLKNDIINEVLSTKAVLNYHI